VSNEYCTYKREAEQQVQQLELERDAYREQAETALVLREVSGMWCWGASGRDTSQATQTKQLLLAQHP
jgi:hypothetical protein